jgi:hypothetical protein
MANARSILHLHGVSRSATLDALDAVMQELGFGRDIAYVLGHHGPRDMVDFEVMVRKQPLYLLSDPMEEWAAAIPAHTPSVSRAPDAAHLARLLSHVLECPALSLGTDADSGFSYRLFHLGSLIGGNRIPGGDGALAALEAYLPPGATRAQLEGILRPEGGAADGPAQLEAFAGMLKLDGRPRYLLSSWETSKEIPWTRFFASSYFPLRVQQKG